MKTKPKKTSSSPSQDYNALKSLSRQSRILQGILSLLDWDQETYMPEGASLIRAEQQGLLAGMVHSQLTTSPFKNALQKLIDIKTGKIKNPKLSAKQKTALKEWRKDYLKNIALPAKFVEEFTKLTSQSVLVWRSAKEENAFLRFAPYLDKIIDMNRRKADYLGYKNHPYDALLDLYEPGMTIQEIDPIFARLRKAVVSLLKRITEVKQVDDQCLHQEVDDDQQMAFGKKILETMGYDFKHGRIDFSAHPFSSSSHPSDSRITTRIHRNYWPNHLAVVLHEGGHALYEMGLPEEEYGTPLGEPISYGIHESQSRWWETRIGQSLPFWKYLLPLVKKAYPSQKLSKTTVETIYKAINKVEPTFIRVDADEVTYTLHIILRYELEKALIEGSLKIRDVPEAWNAKMKELLDLSPKTLREGCLQDIHWSMGAFGYFPSYSLGNLYASHFFQAFEKDHPDWEKRVEKGDLIFIKEWLNKNVHAHGRGFSSKDLMQQVTKKPFSEEAFVRYLTKKYEGIYKLK